MPSYRHISAGLLAGLAAGCAIVLVQLLGRVFLLIPTIPELIQDALVRSLPGPVFAFMLERLLYLGKPLMFMGLMLLTIAIAGVGGVINLKLRRPYLLGIAGFILAELLVTLAGHPTLENPLATIVRALSFLAYSVCLGYFSGLDWRIQWRQQSPGQIATEGQVTRRALIGGGLMFVGSVVLGSRVVGPLRFGKPQSSRSSIGTEQSGTSAPIAGLPAPITPSDLFYVVSKNISDPNVNASSWRLQIGGMVNRSGSLTYEQVQGLEPVEVIRTLECVSNEVGGDLISNGVWTGARLADVLDLFVPLPAATSVQFTCDDGYFDSIPVTKARDASTLLVYQLNGEPLAPKHGYPVRLLQTGTYGMKNSKWITRLDLVTNPKPGFWQQQGWSEGLSVQTMSRIDLPIEGASIPTGEVTVAGIAFSGDRGIQRVEVSSDGGQTWNTAELFPTLGEFTWVFWQWKWTVTRPGSYELVVRATDKKGQGQPSTVHDPFPDGATGYHKVQLRVMG